MFQVKNPDVFRNNIRKELNKKLNNEKHSTNLEKGIFNYTLKEAESKKVLKKWENFDFKQIYFAHFKSIFSNLNPTILEGIENNTIKPQDVAFMTHQELLPDKWASLIDAKSKRDQQKFINNMEASTDTFVCRKCKSRRCTYMSMQTRSADEPTTIFVTCLDCGQRWKTS
jgi:DNA-directed RNA polymerase subunit M/transcription elongation factor TFIIS